MFPIGVRARQSSGCRPWIPYAVCTSNRMLLLENKDFREFIALLNSNRVKFLIVGGHAVAFHGHPRFTGDLDIWVAIDPANARRIQKVLEEFGFGRLFHPKDFEKAGYAIQLGRPPYRIDILTSIDEGDFRRSYARKKTVRIAGLQLPFIGLKELIANKRAAGRPQDLADVDKLQQPPPKTSRGKKGRATGKQ